MKLLGMMFQGLAVVCIGTVLAQMLLLAMFWSKGVFAEDRWMGMMAALQGVKPQVATADANSKGAKKGNDEQPSLDDLAKKRLIASLDLDLRETTLDKSRNDLRTLESKIKTDSEQLDDWKKANITLLARVESTKISEALQELQRTLEVISPKQAKEQILKMLTNTSATAAERNEAMQDIVKILKSMSLDKRKKIIAEFKTSPDTELLADILREIRLGTPDTTELRDSRTRLENNLNPKR